MSQAEQFSYCQPWMLAWDYRKQNLVKELLNYNADIMCLQVRLMSKWHRPSPARTCMHACVTHAAILCQRPQMRRG